MAEFLDLEQKANLLFWGRLCVHAANTVASVALPAALGYVYGKANQPCPVCATPIKHKVIAQRATYYCPHCQH